METKEVKLSAKEISFLLQLCNQVPTQGLESAKMLLQVASKLGAALQENGLVSDEDIDNG